MLYLSTSPSGVDGILAARLQALAAVYGLSLKIADHGTRTVEPGSNRETPAAVDAEMVIGLITRDSKRPDSVLRDIRRALEHHQPAMLLLEKDASAPGLDGVHVITFDRSAPAAHERELAEAVKAIRPECRLGAFWLSVFAMGFINLGGLIALSPPGV